jgi:hypothetical protein
MFDAMLSQLETDLRVALGSCVTGLVKTARARLEGAHADLAKVRAKGLAEVVEEREKALVEVDARRAELGREVEAMHMHREAQQGRVELNIGGYRYEGALSSTSAATGTRHRCSRCVAYHILSSTHILAAGTHRTCAMMAVFSLTGMASTSGTSWNTCAVAWCWWRRPECIRVSVCCGI